MAKTKNSKSRKARVVSQATKDKISKSTKGVPKAPQTQEHKDNISKAMKGKNSGRKHYAWQPFTLVVERVNKDGSTKTTSYDFKGNTPIASCAKKFNLGSGAILYKLKRGEVWAIKKRTINTKHPFKVGTKLSIKMK